MYKIQMIALIANILFSLMMVGTQYAELKITDEFETPIEGVSIKHNNHFWYSDKNGILKIETKLISFNNSISFSHLSYKPVEILFKDLKEDKGYLICHLESDTKSLMEVKVSIFDSKKYVQEAIKMIPQNYTNPFDEGLSLKTDLSLKEVDGNVELIEYKGLLNFSLDKNDLYFIKQPENEFVSSELKNNIFFIKPNYFLNIIPINKHHIIINYKKYEFLDYKEQNAVKIYFERKHTRGYLIIDRDTKAILSINYNVDPTNSWIIGTMKGKGIVHTDINKYFIEANYIKTTSGKYLFDSGQMNIGSKNRWKKKSLSTTYDIYLKRENIIIEKTQKKTAIKDLFK